MAGRPSIFTPEIAETICARLMSGESLREICREDGFPDIATVGRWLHRHDEFRTQYAQAREAQAEVLADEVLEIADDGRNDWMERHGKDDAGWQANGEHIQRSKLRYEARRWYAAKLAPKKFGEKVETEHSGGVTVAVATVDRPPRETREEWLERRRRELGITAMGAAAGTAD